MESGEALSAREREVLALLATSCTHPQIADELHVAVTTVKRHVSHLYAKLGVRSRAEAIERARATGLLPAEPTNARREHPRFEALVMHGRDLVTVIDADRRLVWANPAFRDLLGEEPDAHLGRPAWEIVHPDDRERLGRIFAEVSEKPQASVTFECRLAHADGSWRRVEVHQVNRLADPAVRGFVGNTRDISGHVATAEKLAFEAMHDQLTGLANRALFLDRLQQSLARTRRRKSSCAVMFIDLDKFKNINDQHGHVFGDRVLQAIAARLVEVIRPGDTVARFGGDEFVVLIEDENGAMATKHLAERLRQSVCVPIDIPSGRVVVTCSIGVAATSHSDAGSLLQAADLAMYGAKRAGGDRVEIAGLEHVGSCREPTPRPPR